MNRLTLLSAIFLFISLSGCVQVIELQDTRNSQLAVSSVRDMEIRYPKGSTFALSPKYLTDVSLKPEQVQKFYRLYAESIVKSMQNQGYIFAPANSETVFYVEFALALAEDLDDNLISQKFGVTPGLQGKDNLEKGSFLIAIEDAQSQQRVWRGTVQGFIQDDYSSSERLERIDTVVEMVLSQFSH